MEKLKRLHWLIAFLIIALIAAGVYIVNNELKDDEGPVNLEKEGLKYVVGSNFVNITEEIDYYKNFRFEDSKTAEAYDENIEDWISFSIGNDNKLYYSTSNGGYTLIPQLKELNFTKLVEASGDYENDVDAGEDYIYALTSNGELYEIDSTFNFEKIINNKVEDIDLIVIPLYIDNYFCPEGYLVGLIVKIDNSNYILDAEHDESGKIIEYTLGASVEDYMKDQAASFYSTCNQANPGYAIDIEGKFKFEGADEFIKSEDSKEYIVTKFLYHSVKSNSYYLISDNDKLYEATPEEKYAKFLGKVQEFSLNGKYDSDAKGIVIYK